MGERTRRKECTPLWAGRTGENASDKKLSGYCFDYRRFVAAGESYPADSCSRQAAPTYFGATDHFGSESPCSARILYGLTCARPPFTVRQADFKAVVVQSSLHLLYLASAQALRRDCLLIGRLSILPLLRLVLPLRRVVGLLLL